MTAPPKDVPTVASASAPNEIDGIRRHMAQIRRELHEDVQGVVAGAEAVTDWKRYVRLYPWAFVGLALGAGFLIAPRRRRRKSALDTSATTLLPGDLQDAVREAKEQVKAEIHALSPTPVKKKEEKAGFLGMVAGLVGPILLRTAKSYAMNFAEQWLAQKVAAGQNPLAFLQGVPGMPDLSTLLGGAQEPPPGSMPGAGGGGSARPPYPPYPPGPGQPPYGPGQPPFGAGPSGSMPR